MRALVLLCINQRTEFEMASFTISEYMTGANLKKKTCHVTQTKSLSPPTMKTAYEKKFKILKMGGLG